MIVLNLKSGSKKTKLIFRRLRKMNVKNENVRVLTKEEVIKLSNGVKHREFLDDYECWGVWLDIPELNVQVYKAELPMNRVIYVTRFKNYNTYGGDYASPVYRYGAGKVEYKSYPESSSFVADRLKELKAMLIAEEKKNEG